MRLADLGLLEAAWESEAPATMAWGVGGIGRRPRLEGT